MKNFFKKLTGLTLLTFCVLIGTAVPAEAFFGGFIRTVISAVTGAAAFNPLASIAIGLGLSFISNKLFGPDLPNVNNEQAPDQGVRQQLPTDPSNKLPVVYGESKVYGSITFADITSDNKKMAFLISLCEGDVEEIGDIYWDQYRLTLDSSGNVTNATDFDGNDNDFLNGNLKIVKAPNGGRSSDMESFSTKWNTNASERTMPGVAYLYVELTYNRDKRVVRLSRNLHAIVRGKKVRTIDGYNSSDVITTTASEIVSYRFSTNKVYSNNPAECLADYQTDTVYGTGLITSDSDIDLQSYYNHKVFCNVRLATNDADGNAISTTNNVANDIERTKRYTVNGYVNTNDSRDKALRNFTLNSQGILSYQFGTYQLITDHTGTSVKTFDDSNIFGDFEITDNGFNTLLNQVDASYTSKLNNYQDTQLFKETPSTIKSPTEPQLLRNINFKFLDKSTQVDRLVTTILNRSRQTQSVTFRTSLEAFSLQPGDVITVNKPNRGISNKLYRIINILDAELPNNGVNEEGISGFTIQAHEYAAADYTSTTLNEFDTAPNITIPNANNIGKVGTVSSSANSPMERTVTLSWPVPAGLIHLFDVFTGTASDTPVNDRVHVATFELPNGDSYTQGDTVTEIVNNVPESSTLHFFVRARNNLGFIGQFSDAFNFGNFNADDLDVQEVFVYKRATTISPTDAPSINLTYNFSAGTKTYAGSVSNSNNWYREVSEIPSSQTGTLYFRSTFVNNANGNTSVIAFADWGSAMTSGAAGTNGISVATLLIYSTSSTTPTGGSYVFNTNTLSSLPSGWFRNRSDVTLADGQSLYVSQANISTQTPGSAITSIIWSEPVLANTVIFEVYAYLAKDTNTAPGTPQTGTGTITEDELTGAPTRAAADTSGTWLVELPDVSDTNQYIYRSVATVTNGTIGDWSSPSLFTLRPEQGPTGPTNLVRYGRFNSDEMAILAHQGITDADGLNSDWVSTPDLLGVDGMNNPQNFTHTISQFGTITTGGVPTTNNYTLAGSVGSGGETRYQRDIDYSETVPATQWQGRAGSFQRFTLNSGIGSNDSNGVDGTPGWFRSNDTTIGRTGYYLPASNWNNVTSGTITFSGTRTFYVAILSSSDVIDARAQASGTDDIVNNQNSFINRICNIQSAFAPQPGVFSTPTALHPANNSLDIMIAASNENDMSPVTVELGFLGAGQSNPDTGTRFPVMQVGPVTTASFQAQYDTDWAINDGRHTGINIGTSFGTSNVSGFTGTTPSFDLNQTATNYMSALRTYLLTNTNINTVTATTVGTNAGLIIDWDPGGFQGNQFDATPNLLTGPGGAPASNGKFSNPSMTNALVSDTTTVLPAASTLTITPTLSSSYSPDNIDGNTRWYYSDASTDEPIVGTYDGNEANLTALLSTVVDELNNQTHIANASSSNATSIALTYDEDGNYNNPGTGTSTAGPLARNPNAVINFGVDNNGAPIMNGVSLSAGYGGGTAVNTIDTCRVVSTGFNSSSNFLLDFDIDNNGPSIHQQIINLANVLYPGYYDITNITETGTRVNLDKGGITTPGASAPDEDITVLTTGTGGNSDFTNASTTGIPGVSLQLVMRRTTADEFNNQNITIQLTENETTSQVIDAIADLAPAFGAYVVKNNNTSFTIQDAGTGPTTFTFDTIPSQLGITLTEGTSTEGTSAALGTDFQTGRWTRPVNNGVQVS